VKLISEEKACKLVRKAKADRIANPIDLENALDRYLQHKRLAEAPWHKYAEEDLAEIFEHIRTKGKKP
jgi:hypothetical protein